MEEVGLIERQSSIENEPRTLDISQIEFAREVALYVVNTKSIEEAMDIFTEGLEPVVRCKGESGCMSDNAEDSCDRINNDITGIRVRDIVSAPF